MGYQGVVFDFNGTLFWDTPLHNQAWDIFLKRYGYSFSDEEKSKLMYGKNNADILELIFQKRLKPEEITSMTKEKEACYRRLCLQNKSQLAPGAYEFLDYLKAKKISLNIATASNPANVEFFFNLFNLARWFQRSLVVCDEGFLPSKPHPAYYLEACSRLNLKPSQVLVFEDSPVGIESARRAGVGEVIIVDSHGQDLSPYPYKCITDYRQIDHRLFS